MQTELEPVAHVAASTPSGRMPRDDIFARIRDGKNVRVAPLAEAIGMSRGGLYGAIEAGDVEAVKIGRAVFVPAHVARRLLGMKSDAIAA
ncbi:hypothetical protein [Methylobacterium pseudosasicola]|uniref:DNA binding domain-containing protein, excisionase family n=1 Tax=Methylobacterium pseudosasicola TaxID=582667 RepID=A0A1I4SDC3_9HYPH|nr:hypothetical protein [Methylobacterium pseudosasicola]SFM62489.1 hypothetical protein SAMN05192568_104163 [Methylobacterium pseudosasicola]